MVLFDFTFNYTFVCKFSDSNIIINMDKVKTEKYIFLKQSIDGLFRARKGISVYYILKEYI